MKNREEKRINLVFIFLLISSINCGAQNKLAGLGSFRVGITTINQMHSLIDTNAGKMIYDSGSREFRSDGYEIAGVYLEDLHFYFFKDTLYNISCKPSNELFELLTLKYGRPQKKSLKKVTRCINNLGIEFNKYAESVEYIFPSAANVRARYANLQVYDSDCQLQSDQSFDIFEKRLSKLAVRAWSKDELKKLSDQERLRKREMKEQIDRL